MEVWCTTEGADPSLNVDRWLRLTEDSAPAPPHDQAPMEPWRERPEVVHVHVRSEEDQHLALTHVGLAPWVLLSFEDWSMIPVENLVAAAQGSPTRIAALLRSPSEVAGAAFALQTGVDAVAVPPEASMIEAALAMKAARGMAMPSPSRAPSTPSMPMGNATLLEVLSVAAGERACVDLAGLLEDGEGMLVGSSACPMLLVHGETVPSSFVPTRPFRVNAGAVHQYVLMPDGSTRYLSELRPGDVVLVADRHGTTRHLVVGRVKIERRPLLLLRYKDGKGQEGHALLQNAETVRAVGPNGTAHSITTLQINDQLTVWSGGGARHLGHHIASEVKE
jgi:3-dehydroquinate synthase II